MVSSSGQIHGRVLEVVFCHVFKSAHSISRVAAGGHMSLRHSGNIAEYLAISGHGARIGNF